MQKVTIRRNHYEAKAEDIGDDDAVKQAFNTIRKMRCPELRLCWTRCTQDLIPSIWTYFSCIKEGLSTIPHFILSYFNKGNDLNLEPKLISCHLLRRPIALNLEAFL